MSSNVFSIPTSLSLPFRLGVGAYGLFIVWASLRPTGASNAIPHTDKVLHLLVYALLGGAITLAWPKLSKWRIFWGCVVLGAALELGQGLMETGRTASIWDALANSIGAALGIYAVVLMSRIFTR